MYVLQSFLNDETALVGNRLSCARQLTHVPSILTSKGDLHVHKPGRLSKANCVYAKKKTGILTIDFGLLQLGTKRCHGELGVRFLVEQRESSSSNSSNTSPPEYIKAWLFLTWDRKPDCTESSNAACPRSRQYFAHRSQRASTAKCSASKTKFSGSTAKRRGSLLAKYSLVQMQSQSNRASLLCIFIQTYCISTIVSSCGSPTEDISRFVDHFLQPLTRALPSYIQDTTDFLQKLQELPILPPESLLVTLDVPSLYTNTPHDEGVNACEEFLNTRTDQSPPSKDLCQLIQLILESNAFIFNGAYDLQQQGTAMGTQMAPQYTNLFMGKFEQQFLQTQNKLPLVWWRYIDDVFAIWTHRVPCLNAFLQELNNYHTTIKFQLIGQHRKSHSQIRGFTSKTGVETDLHVKPSSKHQISPHQELLSQTLQDAIQYSQALRIKRICSERENLLL